MTATVSEIGRTAKSPTMFESGDIGGPSKLNKARAE
jgi:hypothetical protein